MVCDDSFRMSARPIPKNDLKRELESLHLASELTPSAIKLLTPASRRDQETSDADCFLSLI
jgi:hypothetical protein